ncbi:MAG: hypothetical protein M3463_15095 [Verrucomicrobiota bacterium]|nr:hypothetical protein [Verrucomicrobiota bacterium]
MRQILVRGVASAHAVCPNAAAVPLLEEAAERSTSEQHSEWFGAGEQRKVDDHAFRVKGLRQLSSEADR